MNLIFRVDYSVLIPTQAKETINFNICKPLMTPKCPAKSMAEIRDDAGECADDLTNAVQMTNIKYAAIQADVDGIEFRFPPGSFKIGDQPAELKLSIQCARDTNEISF